MPLVVGHFDADGVLARQRGDDSDARHAQGDGQIVGQSGDFAESQAGFQFDLELGDDRPGLDFDDADVEAEIEESLFEDFRFAADFLLLFLEAERFALHEEIERGQLEIGGLLLNGDGFVQFIENRRVSPWIWAG